MSNMGGSCSAQRQRAFHRQNRHNHQSRSLRSCYGGGDAGKPEPRRKVRHSVVSEFPDERIAALYPVDDNYELENHNLRSPKSLVDLCIDAVCRSLANLDGELPPGLPQDVVDDVFQSLLQHSALNATTLRIFKNCELGSLSLAGCRGVSDEWLRPLGAKKGRAACSSSVSHLSSHSDAMDLDEKTPCDYVSASQQVEPCMLSAVAFSEGNDSHSSSSTSSFVSASSTPLENDDHQPLNQPTVPESPKVPIEDFFMHSSAIRSSQVFPTMTSNLTMLDLRGSHGLTDRGLMQLSDLGSLEIALLDHCHSLVGRGLVAFASSHRMHTLSLANCRRLTDEAVVNISHLLSIEALSLDGCRCLTDRSLASLSNLYDLRKLDLSQCDLLTDQGLEHLQELEQLEELSLGWCRLITDRGINTLTQQPCRASTLRVLRLARCPLSDEGARHLGRLRELEELDLNGCANIGSSVLGDTLGRLPKLNSLDVSYCPGILRTSWQGKIKALKTLELCYSGVRDGHLSRLTDLPELEELNLDSCLVGDWGIAHLADNNVVPNLRVLNLADTDLTDLGMIHIRKLKNLTKLSLFYCNITNAGLRNLSEMTNLEVLNLDSREVSDDGLAHLRRLNRLRSLDIFSGRITDTGCAHLSKIKSLESLELCGGGIGDLGCTLLATLDKLTSLNLSQNERITNRGAAALAALSNLRALNLSNTRVNAGALRFLGGLVNLQSMALYGCRGVDNHTEGLNNFQNGLPSLKCLRLNNAPEDDGMIRSNDMDGAEDYSDSDDESSNAPESSLGRHDNRNVDDHMDDNASIYSDND